MKVYSCSDHHFGHRNIIKYVNRPFSFDEVGECDMTKLMVERHNEVVDHNDIVLMIGDLSAGLQGRQELLKQILLSLNGRKILIRGNHDHEPDSFYFDAGFIDVVTFLDIGEYFISHYPCYVSEYTSPKEKQMMKFLDITKHNVVIHGHIHDKDPGVWPHDGIKRINMCVDYALNNYYPQEINFPEIIRYLTKYDSKN